jgi:hypothetical protein
VTTTPSSPTEATIQPRDAASTTTVGSSFLLWMGIVRRWESHFWQIHPSIVRNRSKDKESMNLRYGILLWLIAVIAAFVLRYALARFFITFHTGGASRGTPINNIAFWLVSAIAGLVTLVKVVRAR